MRYLMLEKAEQAALLAELEAMPGYLVQAFGALSAEDAGLPGPDDTFSPVEQCWHLADLEREGFALRIRRLREESEPLLPDFDGARIARERRYRSRVLEDGLEAFRAARLENVRTFRSLALEAWERRGEQEGVGTVRLCDIPAMMAEHDAAHREEIEAWKRARRPA